jgi:hypothetical protein
MEDLDLYWVTKDKKKMLISDMSDSHLDNAIRIFEKTSHIKFNNKLYNRLVKEREFRTFMKTGTVSKTG